MAKGRGKGERLEERRRRRRKGRQGSLKDPHFGQSKHVAVSTKINGNHHLQGNVQVYNVRKPGRPKAFSLSTNDCCSLFESPSSSGNPWWFGLVWLGFEAELG